MPTNIKNTIQTVIVDAIVQENAATGGKSPTAQRLHELSLAAIVAGQGNPQGAITAAWRDYMTFLLTGLNGGAANATDLARLLPEDGTTDALRQTERAYLTGNGMCGTGTGAAVLDGGTTNNLDQDPA